MNKLSVILFFAFLLWAVNSIGAAEKDPPFKIYPSQNGFELTVENVKTAIENQGMIVRSELNIQDMLERTAEDLGFDDLTYDQAISIEFCNAQLTHQMVRLDPRNISLCPFVISIYALKGEAEAVYVSYRQYRLFGDANDLLESIHGLHHTIATEAIEEW